jgi:hypothetical protein
MLGVVNLRQLGWALWLGGIAILAVGPIVVRKADWHPGHAIPIGAFVMCVVGVLMHRQRPNPPGDA